MVCVILPHSWFLTRASGALTPETTTSVGFTRDFCLSFKLFGFKIFLQLLYISCARRLLWKKRNQSRYENENKLYMLKTPTASTVLTDKLRPLRSFGYVDVDSRLLSQPMLTTRWLSHTYGSWVMRLEWSSKLASFCPVYNQHNLLCYSSNMYIHHESNNKKYVQIISLSN